MVPFLAVFALWHPAANSSQRRASPGGCGSPWPQLGCLFSAGHRAGEKSSISLPVLNFSALPDFLSRLASSRATRRGTREVSPSFLSARAGSARLRVLVNGFLQQGPRGRKRRRRRRRASEEVTLRHKDNKKRKYRVSPHLLGVSVFGGTDYLLES